MGARFRLYPAGDGQERDLRSFCDQERFLFNLSVEQYEFAARYRAFASSPLKAAPSREHWPSHLERNRQLTELRAAEGMEWLAAGSRQVQAQALRVVDQAYRNWFSNPRHFRRPCYRSRNGTQGFGVAGRKPGQPGGDWGMRQINHRWAEARLPKIGRVRFRLTMPYERIAAAKSCRVTLDRVGRWHIAFPGPQPQFCRRPTGAVIGVDRGVANTVATSDGQMGHAPSLTKGEAERVLRLERHLARQQKGSRRRERTKRAKAKTMARFVDRRRDWIEKSTSALVRDHDIIVVERLDVIAMTASARGSRELPGRNVRAKAGLNRAILAQCWALWLTRLKQKAATCGVVVVEVSARNTSRRCADCGHTEKNNRESQAVFSCKACGHMAHADVNAAINIRDRGMSYLAGGSTATAQGDPRLLRSMNCEAPGVAA